MKDINEMPIVHEMAKTIALAECSCSDAEVTKTKDENGQWKVLLQGTVQGEQHELEAIVVKTDS